MKILFKCLRRCFAAAMGGRYKDFVDRIRKN